MGTGACYQTSTLSPSPLTQGRNWEVEALSVLMGGCGHSNLSLVYVSFLLWILLILFV